MGASSLVVISVAGVSVAYVARWRRLAYRRELNAALHELRRPLQGLALAIEGQDCGAGSCLDATAAALAELDRVINGSREGAPVGTTGSVELIAEAVERWGVLGRVEAGRCDDVRVPVEGRRLAAALDNLIANAVEHGRGPVRLRAILGAGMLRLQVRNEPAGAGGGRRPGPDPRRGHGLRIAAQVAGEANGRLRGPTIDRDRVLTELELPVESRVADSTAR